MMAAPPTNQTRPTGQLPPPTDEILPNLEPPPEQSSQLLYKPTPPEEAYAFYILAKAFSINNYFSETEFCVPGNLAVPFLCSSGVDRLILRNIWAVADPTLYGSLTHINQFHCVLRLVSLAQAGFVERDLAQSIAGQMKGREANKTPPEVIMETLMAHRKNYQVPLPRFEGIRTPPSDVLKGIYELVHRDAKQTASNNNNKNSNNDCGKSYSTTTSVTSMTSVGWGFPETPQEENTADEFSDFGGFQNAPNQSQNNKVFNFSNGM